MLAQPRREVALVQAAEASRRVQRVPVERVLLVELDTLSPSSCPDRTLNRTLNPSRGGYQPSQHAG